MVSLLSKTEIQSLNIDTVEKALVFGALALRAALVGSDSSFAADSSVALDVQTVSNDSASLKLEFFIRYDAYQFNVKGGELLDNILEYSSNAPNLELDLDLGSQPTTSGLTIPDYDVSVVDTFEKYLVYYAKILWASVANKNDGTISISFLSQQDNPQIWIQAQFPLDLNQWLLGTKYLDAISTVVDAYIAPNPGSGVGGSGSQINNYLYLFEALSAYYVETLHTVTNPGVLEKIVLDADYDSPSDVTETYFYLNDVAIYPIEYVSYSDGSFDIIFDPVNDPISLAPGDVITFEVTVEPEPTYMDFNLYINEPILQ